jgi:hypothetical protein
VDERFGGHSLAGQREQFGAQALALGQAVMAKALEAAGVDGDRQRAGVGEEAW